MGLKHIKLPSAEVEFSGSNIAVRGLSLDDVAYLVRQHQKSLETLYNEFQAVGDLSASGAMAFVGPLVERTPQLAADIIACGAGDHEDAGIARTLPFPVQVELLEHIIRLTFSSEGGPKKLLETVVRLTEGTTALVDTLKA